MATDHSRPTAEDLWRPIYDIGPIRVGKRQSVSALVEQARVRFLQDVVGSGETVQLEVLLPAAAPEDIRVVVQLVPGSGETPAVAGEDFVDEPVMLTVRRGTMGSTVSITLLRNNRHARTPKPWCNVIHGFLTRLRATRGFGHVASEFICTDIDSFASRHHVVGVVILWWWWWWWRSVRG